MLASDALHWLREYVGITWVIDDELDLFHNFVDYICGFVFFFVMLAVLLLDCGNSLGESCFLVECTRVEATASISLSVWSIFGGKIQDFCQSFINNWD